MTVVASDLCERTVAAGSVGTMDLPVGGTYTLRPGGTGSNSRYSCDGHNIQIHGIGQPASTDIMSLSTDGTFGCQNQNFLTVFALDAAAVGATQTLSSYGRFIPTSSGTAYIARLAFATSGTVTLFLDKVVVGTSSLDLVGAGGVVLTSSYVPGTKISVRLTCNGSAIAAKAWFTANAETTAVTQSVTDTAIPGEGATQWRLNLATGSTATPNLLIDSWSCDNISYSPTVDTITRYGVSKGHLNTYDTNLQQRYVNTAALIYGPNSYFRTDITTSTTNGSWDSRLADFETFCGYMAAAGITLFPCLHMITGTTQQIPLRNGLVTDPVGLNGMMPFYTMCYNAVQLLGPGGTMATTLGSSWKPCYRYEIWNEPNTTSGNANRQDDASGTISNGFATGGPFAQLDMSYADIAEILRCGVLGIRAAATAMGFSAYIYGLGMGGVDVSYLKGIVDWCASNGYTNPLTTLDAVSTHVYPTNPPIGPAGTYPPGTDNPTAQSSGQTRPRDWATLATLRQYLAASGGSACKIGVTEGGYRGNDLRNINRTATVTGSNFTLPASSIPVASTALFPAANGTLYLEPATVVSNSGSSITLPASTIPLADARGFPASGSVSITADTRSWTQTVSYTSIVGNVLQGCSGGTGTIPDGSAVTGNQQVSYKTVDPTHFLGCVGGSGTIGAGTVLETCTAGNIFYASPDRAAADSSPDQATWNMQALDMIQQHNSYWNVDIHILYELFDELFPTDANLVNVALGKCYDTTDTSRTTALTMGFWKSTAVQMSRKMVEYGLHSWGGSTPTPAGTVKINVSGSTLRIHTPT
jgi:hypothetical protein